MNFYLWENRDDPGEMLKWLEGELREMEKNGEIGIVIGHVPPGHDCMYNWAIRFNALMERFQHVVRTNLYGHVHHEAMGTARSISSGKAIANHWWTGSMTTFYSVNPSFRVFDFDAETMLPVKIHTYKVDVRGDHVWKYDHELTELYGIEDLSPRSIEGLADKIKDSEEMAMRYYNMRSLGGEETHIDSCDEKCRMGIHCQVRNSVYFDEKDCKGEKRIDFVKDPINSLVETLGGTWYRELNQP